MRHLTRSRLLPALLAVVSLSLVATVLTVGGSPVTALEPGTGLPLAPRTDTPRIVGGTITDQALLGNQIIIVGTFEEVVDTDGTVLDQKYIVSYDIDSGQVNRDFDPVMNKEVITVEPDGLGGLLVGGRFNSIDGSPQNRLARLDATGERVASFRAEANAKVTHIAVGNGRAYVGGPFSAVKARGTWSDRSLLAAFMLDDGTLDEAFDFPITGPAGRGGELGMKGLGFAGDDLVVSHTGTRVDGESRVAAAIITTTPVEAPALRTWRTDFYKNSVVDAGQQLANTEMAVSPDGTYFVVVGSGGDRPLEGKDAAVRFPVAGGADVQPEWVSRHFDSMFAVGISDKAIFVGGHFQYQEAPGSPNPYPGDPAINYGAGAGGLGPAVLGNQVVAREQIGALDPATGKSLNWSPGASAEIGVESLVVIDRGLLVGQDGDVLGGKDLGRHGFFDIATDVAPANGLTTTITSHFDGETADAGVVTLAGRATDDDAGVKRVQLAIRHEPSGQWLQPDGSLGPWARLDAVLETQGTDIAWSLSQTFTESGDYRVQAKTFTLDGRKDPSPAYISLDVRPAGDTLPGLEVESALAIGRTVTVTGIATDDRGIAQVNVSLQTRDTNEYIQADGSLGESPNSFVATLAAVDAASTNWQIEIVAPRNGSYRLEANPIDTAGQDDEKFEQRTIIVAENDQEPIVNLATGVFDSEADTSVSIEITAIDDTGFSSLDVRLRRQLTSEGTRPDNTFGPSGAFVEIKEARDQREHTFTYVSPALPAGVYDLVIRGIDLLGQDVIERRTVVVGVLGDAAPTNSVSERVVHDAGGILALSGTARDDIAVESVDVWVRDVNASRWVRPDGSLSPTPAAHTAQLDAPGTATTTWSWSMDAPAESRYLLYALPIDSSAQRASIHWKNTANHWNLPGDTVPLVGLISPNNGDTVEGRIFLTGRATDDVAVDRLRVRLRREADRTYLQLDGTFGKSYFHLASLTNPDRPGTNWDWATPELEAGDYRIELLVRDDTGREIKEVVVVTVQ